MAATSFAAMFGSNKKFRGAFDIGERLSELNSFSTFRAIQKFVPAPIFFLEVKSEQKNLFIFFCERDKFEANRVKRKRIGVTASYFAAALIKRNLW